MSTFSDFLKRNSVSPSGALPLVHTTRGLNISSIKSSNTISTTECDVFVGEQLNYFFVGRPAYKPFSDSSESEYWELPFCFIFEFSSIDSIARIFPFDSGAMHRGIYPSYISKFPRDAFEISSTTSAPDRIIGAFFGSPDAYFMLKAKDKVTFEKEFSLSPLDADVRALHRLATEKPPKPMDDRRFAIEVQSNKNIDLNLVKPIAIVAPSTYYDDLSFRTHVTDVWKAHFLHYPMYPLSSEGYYGLVYDRIYHLYKSLGLL